MDITSYISKSDDILDENITPEISLIKIKTFLYISQMNTKTVSHESDSILF